MASEVSPTRLYLGNLPRAGMAFPHLSSIRRNIMAQCPRWYSGFLVSLEEDIYAHFKEAPGEITEVKLMNGFGFIEYKDAMDARDVVPSECSPSLKKRPVPH
ncbi:MAG: hypothetical protein Q9214_005242 [Letrouitia sp. 1 TL-2023]